jgi:murein L,D-transpeptidase YafK
MWQTFKRLLLLQAKMLEIRYVTWIKRREIARAYRERTPLSSVVNFWTSHARALAVAGGLIVVALVLCAVAPIAVRSIASAARALRHSFASAAARPHSQQPAVVQLPAPTPAEPKPQPAAVPSPQPNSPAIAVQPLSAPLPEGGEPFAEQMLYCIVANKATKQLYFLAREREGEPWRVVEQCPAVMGRNEGQKQVAGDRRTPEGTYFVIGRKDGWELSAIYGPVAYVLNYPNEEDRRAGRTGEGIWIHGMPEDSSRMVTRGCIVLHNDYLLALSKYLKLGIGTPVVIVDKGDIGHPEQVPDFPALERRRIQILTEYRKRQEDFAGMLVRWKRAWETKDIETYASFYDRSHFEGGGLSWSAWREKKLKTFEMYSTIGISLDKIRVVDFSESTAVVIFLQLYESDVSKKQNAKKLSLVKNGGQWLINREETFSNEEFFL